VASGVVFSARCCILDVGQGSSQVILLGEGRAIVLDGGPSASVPLGSLKDRGVNTLEALIISHNDYDHDKGACEVLINYKDALKRLLFLEDRPIQKIRI